jgi:Ca-activated chloride channel family protein
MGIGIDFGQELALAITRSRGGNYIFLSNAARIATVFDQDFDFLMTPLAYDLSMTLTAGSGYRIAETYGLPASREGRSATIEAATVFLSRNRGAVLARLVPAMAWDDGRLLAETTLAYSGRDTGAVTRRKPCGYEGGEPLGESTVWFSQRGVSRTVAVVNAGVAVRRALELYAMGRVNEALSQISLGEGALRDQLRSDPASADLRADLDLLQRLQINMDRWQGGYDRPEDPYAHQPYQPPPHYHGPFGCSAAPGAGAPGVLGLGLALLCLVPLLRRRTPGALRA